jgi:mono/diheme cytochrome c family protein
MQQFPMDLHYQRVNEGTPNGMPAWKGNLSDLQIWQVIMYERSFCQLFTPAQ